MNHLWETFDLHPNSTIEEIDNAYVKTRANFTGDKKILRLLWKILRDPFASSSFSYYKNPRAILDAGFFDDGIEPEDFKPERDNLNWLTTPVHKIKNNLDVLDLQTLESFASKPAVILLSTGSFCPIHQGHLMMMENAKKELEAKGLTILGGYFSPSHDSYVSAKYKDALYLDAPHRTRLCEKAVAYSDWLMVDQWESRYNDSAITYTDVLIRLESYLKKHLLPRLNFEIYYVFGGDNSAFARLFIKRGGCVCIKRPSHEDRMLTINHDPLITSNNKIHIVDAFFDQPNVSSTQIRDGNVACLESIESTYKKWFDYYTHPVDTRPKFTYCIRNDSRYATKIWSPKLDPIDLTLASIEFMDKLNRTLENVYANCFMPDQPIKIYPVQIDMNEQQDYVSEYDRQYSLLNLDACTHSSIKFDLSRHFGISDGQCRWEHLINRPGTPSISQQFSSVKDGEYFLVDDDIATGFTVNTLIKLAPPGIKITQKQGLLQKYLDNHQKELNPDNDRPLLDICDFRDFLVGSKDSGLVVSLPDGQLVRAPYTFPYVSLVSRASIPPSMELSTAIVIWQLNVNFHHYLHGKLILSDSDPSFTKLMNYIGFKNDTPLIDICRWHVTMLKRLAFK